MFLEELRQLISCTVSECLSKDGINAEDIVTVKRNRDLLRGGDFAVSVPKKWKEWSAQTTLQVAKALLELEGNKFIKVHSNGDLLVIHINRTLFFKHCVTAVLNEGENYGRSQARQTKCCVYSTFDTSETFTVDQLRTALLNEHIFNLLLANGYDTRAVLRHHGETAGLSSLQETFRLLNISAETETLAKHQARANEHFCTLANCPWRHNEEKENVVQQKTDERSRVADKAEVVLDLRRFAKDRGLKFDKQGYRDEVGLMTVTQDDTAFQKAVDVAEILNTMLGSVHSLQACCFQQASRFVHVDEAKREVESQRIDLVSRIVASGPASHAHVSHRGVHHKKGDRIISAQEHFSLRAADMESAFASKYGDTQDGQEIAHRATQAAVKFDLLRKTASVAVKLSAGEQQEGSQSRLDEGGVSVMYNAARISAILEKFQEKVKQGIYPALPDVSEIDFTTLREEEEWNLVYNYLATFPDVVRQTVVDLDTDVARPQVHSHRICHFLVELAAEFSVYYSNRHVLTEPMQHLLPAMFARLTLLTAVQRVFRNALRLLNLEPLNRM